MKDKLKQFHHSTLNFCAPHPSVLKHAALCFLLWWGWDKNSQPAHWLNLGIKLIFHKHVGAALFKLPVLTQPLPTYPASPHSQPLSTHPASLHPPCLSPPTLPLPPHTLPLSTHTASLHPPCLSPPTQPLPTPTLPLPHTPCLSTPTHPLPTHPASPHSSTLYPPTLSPPTQPLPTHLWSEVRILPVWNAAALQYAVCKKSDSGFLFFANVQRLFIKTFKSFLQAPPPPPPFFFLSFFAPPSWKMYQSCLTHEVIVCGRGGSHRPFIVITILVDPRLLHWVPHNLCKSS